MTDPCPIKSCEHRPERREADGGAAAEMVKMICSLAGRSSGGIWELGRREE